MNKNYTQRLDKLRKRRLDESIQKAILSKSFSDINISESVKYALEAMSEIDPNYTKNTYLASENIRTNLTTGLIKKGLSVEYRHQGSIETNTHIKIHSDIDILVFTDKYFSVEPPVTVSSVYQGSPLDDLRELRQECFNVLNGIYSQVDNSNSKAITVYPTNPKRKVEVVPSNWVDTSDYRNYSLEIYRGVHIYDKDSHTREKDFPFLHINRVNTKDSNVNGGLRRLSRLLKTLKVDADYEIKLSSFEIVSSVYGMDNSVLTKHNNQQLLLLNEGSKHLEKLISDSNYRENLVSPNGKEKVYGTNSSKVVELKKLKLELDELIQDVTEELGRKLKRIDETLIYS
ncbi:MAG: hypothetical protein IT233_09175 [Bacteroidia bacterium]|nr:hypothetical protein [Bacteroidia bacterium]